MPTPIPAIEPCLGIGESISSILRICGGGVAVRPGALLEAGLDVLLLPSSAAITSRRSSSSAASRLRGGGGGALVLEDVLIGDGEDGMIVEERWSWLSGLALAGTQYTVHKLYALPADLLRLR
jgi:hypothetical protein